MKKIIMLTSIASLFVLLLFSCSTDLSGSLDSGDSSSGNSVESKSAEGNNLVESYKNDGLIVQKDDSTFDFKDQTAEDNFMNDLLGIGIEPEESLVVENFGLNRGNSGRGEVRRQYYFAYSRYVGKTVAMGAVPTKIKVTLFIHGKGQVASKTAYNTREVKVEYKYFGFHIKKPCWATHEIWWGNEYQHGYSVKE